MKPKISATSFAALLLIGGVSLVFAQKKTPHSTTSVAPVLTGKFEKVPLSDEPPLSAEELASSQLMRDRGLLNEVLTLNFAPVTAQPNGAWVVAQFSGESAMEVQGEYDPKTRTIRALEEPSQDKARVYGEYRVVAALTRAPQQMRARYSWKASPLGLFRETRDNRIDFLFGSNVTLICRINGAAQGRERFGPFTIIPPEWAPFVKPAFDFYTANPALFTAPDVTAQRAQLTALLSDPNPFLALFACRTLARAGQLDAAAWSAAINRATGLGQAALIAASAPALLAPPKAETPEALAQGTDALESQLSGAVKNAANAETLKPLALGIASLFEAAPFDPFEPKQRAEWERARRLLEAVRLKGRSFKTQTAADAYVASLSSGLDTTRDAMRAGKQAVAEAEPVP